MSEKHESSSKEALKLLVSGDCPLNFIQFVLQLFISFVF